MQLSGPRGSMPDLNIEEHSNSDGPGKGFVVWLTGLSGAGKTTLANGLEAALIALREISEKRFT